MKKDVFLRAVSAGMLSAVVYALVELVAIKTGLQHTSVWEAAAGMFLPASQVSTQLGTLIGLTGHFIIGGLWGISFYIFLLYAGVSRSILKGMLVGFYLWLLSTIMMRWGVTSYVYFDSNEQLGALIATLIFGLSLGFLVPRMAMQNISESNSIFRGILANILAQPAYKTKLTKSETEQDFKPPDQN
ncbi:Hypothetical protein LUCI_2636 [Lucifera butyrica]|uniref:Uncharacterized protein n=1 Tax=Lucifera butyrica TaxID=1351585 RepID=A0A498RAT1_9FIRM|nr:hypothetical protein [Lucifera butyrica]VBB07392.1 Hypothetical protein LUCI_2636 [Lucifera butyrica]